MSSLSLLETNYQCDDYGCDSGYCKHYSESAFDKSNDEQMSEMSSKEYPVRVKEKSGKGGRKITATSDKKEWQMQLFKENMFLLFYWHRRRRRAYKQLHSHPISEHNAMRKYFIPFIPLHDFLKPHQEIHRVHISI